MIWDFVRYLGFGFSIANGADMIKKKSAIVFEAWIAAKEKIWVQLHLIISNPTADLY